VYKRIACGWEARVRGERLRGSDYIEAHDLNGSRGYTNQVVTNIPQVGIDDVGKVSKSQKGDLERCSLSGLAIYNNFRLENWGAID
jgi:hypothetical protein